MLPFDRCYKSPVAAPDSLVSNTPEYQQRKADLVMGGSTGIAGGMAPSRNLGMHRTNTNLRDFRHEG